MIIKQIKDFPSSEMCVGYLEVILMPNGKVISNGTGKFIGDFKIYKNFLYREVLNGEKKEAL